MKNEYKFKKKKMCMKHDIPIMQIYKRKWLNVSEQTLKSYRISCLPADSHS